MKKLLISELKRHRREDEAQSARSERFNTIRKSFKVDQFKHRCGPKAKKYR